MLRGKEEKKVKKKINVYPPPIKIYSKRLQAISEENLYFLFFNWVACLLRVESCEFFIYFGDQALV